MCHAHRWAEPWKLQTQPGVRVRAAWTMPLFAIGLSLGRGDGSADGAGGSPVLFFVRLYYSRICSRQPLCYRFASSSLEHYFRESRYPCIICIGECHLLQYHGRGRSLICSVLVWPWMGVGFQWENCRCETDEAAALIHMSRCYVVYIHGFT